MNTYEEPLDPKQEFLKTNSAKALFVLNGVMALVYLYVLTFLFPQGNPVLFGLLIGGEVFHIWQVITFLYTVWDTSYEAPKVSGYAPRVDVFITVAGEPLEVVAQTAQAALKMYYPNFRVYILNDGFVAKKNNWREAEALAAKLGIVCITRTRQGGAKAGNINNALRQTDAPLIAIFDADHVPHRDFLEKTTTYFGAGNIAFVQTPQFYRNFAKNYLSQSAWEQQELFFGPICKGKNRLNAATMCGTNMVISRQALVDVGGMSQESIAEDFVTGMFMHEKGYTSVYVPEVLAEGLATEDFLSYTKQQFRWARGALDVIFKYNPLFRRGMSFSQKIQYLTSASYFLSGIVVLIDAALPIIFFYTGLVPVEVSGMLLAAVFLPYIFLTLYCIQYSSNFMFTFPSLALSMGAFTIHLRALWAAATRRKDPFVVTPKEAQSGNYVRLALAHTAYIGLVLFGIVVAVSREGFSASFINNLAWALLNIAIFVPFIRASLPQQEGVAREQARQGAELYEHAQR